MFRFLADTHAHKDDVKSVSVSIDHDGRAYIASASRDGYVKLWEVANDTSELRLVAEHHEHSGFVNAVALYFRQPADCGEYAMPGRELTVASGGTEGVIFLFDVSSQRTVGALIGHQGNVCYLKASGVPGSREGSTPDDGDCGDQLLSCSWDKSTKVWNRMQEVSSLVGHTEAVWGTCLVSSDAILTASADRTIGLWQGGRMVKVFSGHEDAVRGVVMLEGPFSRLGDFASVSNDGKIKIWNLAGGQCVLTISAHDSFIYTIRMIGNLLISGGEDRVIKVWAVVEKDAAEHGAVVECIQAIPIPALSIWSIDATTDGRLVCGCSDGRIYVFSSSSEMDSLGDGEMLRDYRGRLSEMQIGSKTVTSSHDSSEKDNASIGEDALLQSGKKVGQTIVVTDVGDGKKYAYQWDGERWDKVGQVVDGVPSSSSQKVTYKDKAYDFVFDVELETEGPALKLPFNNGDNPYSAATKFVADNGLNPTVLDQIVDFLVANTAAKTIGSLPELFNPYASSSGEEHLVQRRKDDNKSGPAYITYTEANIDGMMKKLREFEKLESVKIGEEVLAKVSGVMHSIGKAAPAIEDVIPPLIAAVDSWKLDRLFPVFDAIRIICLLSGDAVMSHYASLSGRIRQIHSIPAAMLTAARLLCNLLAVSSKPEAIVGDLDFCQWFIKEAYAGMILPFVLMRLREITDEKELLLVLASIALMRDVLTNRQRSNMMTELKLIASTGWSRSVLDVIKSTTAS